MEESIPIEIEMPPPPPPSLSPSLKNAKRKTVEHNGVELLTALLLAFFEITDLATLSIILSNPASIKEKLVFNEDADLDKYVKDLESKQDLVKKIIINFRANFAIFNASHEEIKRIYLSGKTNKHQIIKELNAGIDKKDAKADIYVLLQDDRIFGVSCKQSVDATLSNYSVQKMLGSEANVHLTQVRKQFLKDKGYENFNKDERPKVNELFYPENEDNPYWLLMKKYIDQQKEPIGKQLVQYMMSSKVPYQMYEFNSENVYPLNLTANHAVSISFEEHLPYYSFGEGKQRRAAKLFYRLVVNTNVYRVEVRWKGNIHISSPQFCIHKE